jgi:hypothetical protein
VEVEVDALPFWRVVAAGVACVGVTVARCGLQLVVEAVASPSRLLADDVPESI